MSFDNELDWYFNVSDSDLGLKSNCIEACMGTTHLPVSPYFGQATYKGLMPFSARQRKACRKISIIEKHLNKYSKEDRRRLSALFDQAYRFPPEISLLGKRNQLVLFYPDTTLEQLITMCKKRGEKRDKLSRFVQQEYQRLHSIWGK